MRLPHHIPQPLKESTRFTTARPAWANGIRAAIATMVPVVAGGALHLEGAVWMVLGGFSAAILDKGGAYRTRAASMAAFGLVGAATVTLAALAAPHPLLSIALMLAVVTALSFARVYGPGAATVGLTACTVFVVSLSRTGPGVGEALARGGWTLAGTAWTMALALLLWPIHVYRPARRAVAAAYREVADYAAEQADLASGDEDASGWRTLAPRRHPPIRERLEEARAVLAGLRRGRQGESGRGERLLVLLEDADQVFGTLVAVSVSVEAAARDENAGLDAAARALRAVAAALRELARVVETEGRCRVTLPEGWTAAMPDDPHPADPSHAAGEDARARLAHAADLMVRIREFIEAAAVTANGLNDEDADAPTRAVPAAAPAEPPREENRILGPLTSNLTWDSVVLRHALRVGIAATAALALTQLFHLPHGYWVTLTVLVVLQPYTGATNVKGLQRVAGTVVGGVVAAVIGTFVHGTAALLPVMFVLVAVSVALLPLNYAVFSVFLTPAFVLLAEIGAGDWHLAGVRVTNNVIGAALALLAIRLLWPSPERERFPAVMADALRREADYLAAVLARLLSEDAVMPDTAGERRRVGMATTNAEASFQRLVGETAADEKEMEPWMTVLAYVRRLTATVTALASQSRPGEALRPELTRFAGAARHTLARLADAVERGEPPVDLRAPGERVRGGSRIADPLLRADIERATRQIEVLYDAVSRAHAPASPPAAAPANAVPA